MRANYTIDEDGRLTSVTTYPYNPELDAFDFPDDFFAKETRDYRIADGKLVLDPIPKPIAPDPTESVPTWSELAAALKAGVNEI